MDLNIDDLANWDPLDQQAHVKANDYGIDFDRLRNVFLKFAEMGWVHDIFPYVTAFDEAVRFMAPLKALELFENEDLEKLAWRVTVIDFLNSGLAPFYTHQELADLTEAFIVHLESNREHLIETGFPKTVFGKSLWLDWHLNKLYFTKLPVMFPTMSTTYQHPEIKHPPQYRKYSTKVESDKNGNFIFKYKWAEQSPCREAILTSKLIDIDCDGKFVYPNPEKYQKLAKTRGAEDLWESSSPFVTGRMGYKWAGALPWACDGSPIRLCAYGEAGYLPGVMKDEATRLENLRPKLFDIKIEILKRSIESLRKGDATNLWNDSIRMISNNLLAEEAEFLLEKDEYYRGLQFGDFVAYSGKAEEFSYHHAGLSDLFEIIGHYGKELKIGTMHYMRKFLPASSVIPYQLAFSSYYQIIDTEYKELIDERLDLFKKLQDREKAFWSKFSIQLNDALKKKFRVSVNIKSFPTREIAGVFERFAKAYLETARIYQEETGSLPPALGSLPGTTGNLPPPKNIFVKPIGFQIKEERQEVILKGETYRLTKQQIKVVKYLYNQSVLGESWCRSENVIREALGRTYTRTDLHSVFKSRPEAWEDLFLRERGVIRLNIPDPT